MVSLYFFQDNNFTMFQHQQTSGSNLTSPRTLDPTLSTQLEGHPGSHNVNLTPPLNTGMQPHSSGKAEPGLFPTRCFSPNGLEQKRGPRVSEKVNRVLDGSSSISVCRRLLQEVKLDDSKQHKVGVTILTTISSHPVSWLSIFVIVTHSWIVLKFIAEKKKEIQITSYCVNTQEGMLIKMSHWPVKTHFTTHEKSCSFALKRKS